LECSSARHQQQLSSAFTPTDHLTKYQHRAFQDDREEEEEEEEEDD
jgi:hypothetical protein